MNQIIIDSSLTQICVALMENEDLVEVYIERKNNRRTVGDIYKGRVTNVLPGMQAAFVDIGLKKCFFICKRCNLSNACETVQRGKYR